MDSQNVVSPGATSQSGEPLRLIERITGVVTAISMSVRRGAAARLVAQLADLEPDDLVADIGCGPGTAVRVASRRAAIAIGIDPDPMVLGLARQITTLRRISNVTWVSGSAERVPLPDHHVSVVWALSSLHHWTERVSGLQEMHRILKPGGRALLSERLVAPGARGHAAHGITAEGLQELAGDLRAAGFMHVRTDIRRAGHRHLCIGIAEV